MQFCMSPGRRIIEEGLSFVARMPRAGREVSSCENAKKLPGYLPEFISRQVGQVALRLAVEPQRGSTHLVLFRKRRTEKRRLKGRRCVVSLIDLISAESDQSERQALQSPPG